MVGIPDGKKFDVQSGVIVIDPERVELESRIIRDQRDATPRCGQRQGNLRIAAFDHIQRR